MLNVAAFASVLVNTNWCAVGSEIRKMTIEGRSRSSISPRKYSERLQCIEADLGAPNSDDSKLS